MADEESEQKRIARVRELEEMVKKLENENKQLLNKVQTNSSKHKKITGELQNVRDDPSGANKLRNRMGNKMTRNDSPLDDLEDNILNLEQEVGTEIQPDEWLFVSPKLPPTPAHKKVSPQQWLSEGHNRNRDTDLPSLSEVRKTLVFSMNEAENLNRVVPGGAESPPLSPSSMRARQKPANRTAQKYLEQARQRRNSPPSLQFTHHSPSGGSPTLGTRMTTIAKQQQNSDSTMPIVRRWKAKAPSESPQALSDNNDDDEEDEEEEEEVPQVRWRVKQIPSDNSSSVGGGGGGDGSGTLKIKWNPAMAGQYSSSEDEIGGGGLVQPQPQKRQQGYGGGGVANGVPVVKKWKAKVPESGGGGDVPVIKWKKLKVPVEPEPQNEDVPVIKWKAKTPASNNGDVPVVKWKARVPVEQPEPENEDIPVVKWKAKVPAETTPKDEDVPVVRWKAKMPNSSGNGSSPNQKRGIASPRGRGRGLALPSRRAVAMYDESENSEEGVLNGDSEQSGSDASSVENLRVSRYTAHQSGLQKRSSPKAQQSLGLAPPRQGSRNLSPSSRTSSNNSNQASGASRSPSSSPGGGLRHQRKQLHSPSSPGQRSGGGGKPLSSSISSSSGLVAIQQSRGGTGGGLAVPRMQSHQNSGGARSPSSPQQQRTPLGIKESRSSPSSVSRSGMTPPNGQGKARRVLPTPPSAGGGGGALQQQRGKQGAIQGTPTKRTVQQRAKPIPQQQVEPVAPGDDDDTWLEGCF